jgi:hypothetical protein
VKILHRAMHRSPAERFESVEAMRDAVERFVAHRRDEERITEARDRVARLEQVVGGGSEIEIARAYGAARFALREAETARPDFADRDALRERLHSTMARSALDAGKLALAERYLSELATSKDDLKKRLAELRERDAARSRRMHALETVARDQDLDAGSRFRRSVLIGFGGILVLGHFAYGWLDRAGLLTHSFPMLLLQGTGVWLAVTAWLLWKRRALFRNHANNVLFGIAILAFGVQQSLWAALWVLGEPFERGVPLIGITYVLAAGGVTTLVSPRFFPSVIFAVVGLIVAQLYPQFVWEVLGIGSGTSLASVGLAWPAERKGA